MGYPETGTFIISEDPDEMLYNAAFIWVYTVSKGEKIFRQKITL